MQGNLYRQLMYQQKSKVPYTNRYTVYLFIFRSFLLPRCPRLEMRDWPPPRSAFENKLKVLLPSFDGFGTPRVYRVLKYLIGSLTRLVLLAAVKVHALVDTRLEEELLLVPKPSVVCFAIFWKVLDWFLAMVSLREVKSNIYRLNKGIIILMFSLFEGVRFSKNRDTGK